MTTPLQTHLRRTGSERERRNAAHETRRTWAAFIGILLSPFLFAAPFVLAWLMGWL